MTHAWRARSIDNGLDHPLCVRGAFLGSSWALARTSWSMTPYRITSTVPRFPRGNRRRRGAQRQCRRAGLEPTTAVWLRQSSRNDGGARVTRSSTLATSVPCHMAHFLVEWKPRRLQEMRGNELVSDVEWPIGRDSPNACGYDQFDRCDRFGTSGLRVSIGWGGLDQRRRGEAGSVRRSWSTDVQS